MHKEIGERQSGPKRIEGAEAPSTSRIKPNPWDGTCCLEQTSEDFLDYFVWSGKVFDHVFRLQFLE
jgi:hypothetical protein